jgi:hypothetical protein
VIVAGSITIDGESNIAALGKVVEVTGSINVGPTQFNDNFNDFSALVTVGGTLAIRDSNMITMSFPALQTVEGSLIIDANDFPLNSVSLPALTDVNGDVTITDNSSLSCQAMITLIEGVNVAGVTTIDGNAGCF